MYFQHFGLSGPPFQLTTATDLFLSRTNREALAALEWGVLYEPSGYTVLIGETGTGKTTLVSALLARRNERVRAAYLPNPKLSFDDLMSEVAEQLNFKPTGPGKLGLVRGFDTFLRSLEPSERAAIIVDEAQGLDSDKLEEFRLLSNYGPLEQKQLQIVLVGQPELMHHLMTPSLRQLYQRIGARAFLSPLTREESYRYVEHRLASKGGQASQIFAPRALSHLLEQSGGIPRRINLLCHNAMLQAYTRRGARVSLQIARAASSEYSYPPALTRPELKGSKPTHPLPWSLAWTARPAIALTAMVMLGFGTASIFSNVKAGIATPRSSSKVVQTSPDSSDEPLNIPVVKSSPGGHTETDEPLVLTAKPKPQAQSSAEKPPSSSGAGAGAASPEQREIRIRYGDTLLGIARRYLGSATELDRLIAANPQVADINRIYPGDLIFLPAHPGSE
jgi:type II secretory pathway predicted ATPase ExeA